MEKSEKKNRKKCEIIIDIVCALDYNTIMGSLASSKPSF